MATTNYYTANGRIRGESTGGVRTTYGTDALGSVTGTYDQNGNPQNTYLWAPYGTLIQKTGTAVDPKFGWNGASGYRNTGRSYSGFYVRARNYDPFTAAWTAVDLFWPNERAYVYGRRSPSLVVDRSGNLPHCCSDPGDPPYLKFVQLDHTADITEGQVKIKIPFTNRGLSGLPYPYYSWFTMWEYHVESPVNVFSQHNSQTVQTNEPNAQWYSLKPHGTGIYPSSAELSSNFTITQDSIQCPNSSYWTPNYEGIIDAPEINYDSSDSGYICYMQVVRVWSGCDLFSYEEDSDRWFWAVKDGQPATSNTDQAACYAALNQAPDPPYP